MGNVCGAAREEKERSSNKSNKDEHSSKKGD